MEFIGAVYYFGKAKVAQDACGTLLFIGGCV